MLVNSLLFCFFIKEFRILAELAFGGVCILVCVLRFCLL